MFCSHRVLSLDHGADRKNAKLKCKGKQKDKGMYPIAESKVKLAPVNKSPGVDDTHPPGRHAQEERVDRDVDDTTAHLNKYI